jgi:Tol biopolymer transport system component
VADASVTLPAVAEAAEVPLAADGAAQTGVIASAYKLFTQLAPAQQGVAPPTPTATSTPLPPLESVEAVVAIGGVELWDGTSGLLMGQAPQGALFTATARSSDGLWLYGTLEDGSNGWASMDRLIVFDAERLRSEDAVIIPITPTPTPLAGEEMAPAETTGEAAASEVPVLRPTPVAGDTVLAQVTLQDSRLNLRAGPTSASPIIAKALPDERFAILGRDATSKWLQLALPDVAGGFGWATTEFLATDAVIADLPVVDDVSSAPAYQEGTDETKGDRAVPESQEKPTYPDAQGALSGATVARAERPAPVATGLSGKLAIQTKWGGDIYLYDLATGELRLLTGGFDPAISPDGTQVAFTRIGGEHGLYLINVDGTNERKIFSERTHFFSPKWSPDGQYIVFERGDEVLKCALSNVEDPASACLVGQLTQEDEEIQQKLARVDYNGQNYQDIPVLPRARVPDWNSAGIVYQSPGGIQMTQDQPGAQSKLVFFNIRKQYELDPDWQPNGGRIVFQRRENGRWEILSVAPDGSGLTPLTRPTFTLVERMPSNVAPAWSPDGRHIVFLSNRDPNDPNEAMDAWNVWVMDADGSNQRRLEIDLPFTYTFVAEQMLDWGR